MRIRQEQAREYVRLQRYVRSPAFGARYQRERCQRETVGRPPLGRWGRWRMTRVL